MWFGKKIVSTTHQLSKMSIIMVAIAVLALLTSTNCVEGQKGKKIGSFEYMAISCRSHSASLTDFGGVGDGTTSNTKSFQAAMNSLSRFSSSGGSLLFVPPGKWLTGSFTLISHFTLYLHKDAVLLASQNENEWPVIKQLPSYGKGKYGETGRFRSLIFGTNLNDVIITGDKGTINGQGDIWWKKSRTLKYTRPSLIELIYSTNIQISRLNLLNSPSWHIHPVYSSNIIIQDLRIIAPINSPNTDGIDPDSCSNMRIEDCYIVSGDDCVSLKSGWDQYGLAFGMPTKQVIIRRLTCLSPQQAVITLGSEMSGGIQDIRVEDIVTTNTKSGVRIKTAIGRGGFVKDIYFRRMNMKNMRHVVLMTGDYNTHPDQGYNRKAFPLVRNINYRDIVAESVRMTAQLDGISGHPFDGLCFSNVTVSLSAIAEKSQWNCSDVSGVSSGVVPKACGLLKDQQKTNCYFPNDVLPIEKVVLKKCFVK
ncbi:probable polygalacturonase [Cannabis sativa]|uniref:probable polygalacturonase n=1 Tax=Cannabis sativa TaxID=3483 RepID=UPI0029CA3927|nr:probable polygalacturonase [Cannabis sativa]